MQKLKTMIQSLKKDINAIVIDGKRFKISGKKRTRDTHLAYLFSRVEGENRTTLIEVKYEDINGYSLSSNGLTLTLSMKDGSTRKVEILECIKVPIRL